MELTQLLKELHFSGDTRRAIRRKLCRDGERVTELMKTAYTGEAPDFPLCRERPLTRLTVVTCLLPEKFEEYRARGIPEAVILDTFRDVSLRARLHRERSGRAGLSAEDVIWLRHIMGIGLFQLGALQFQPFAMVYLDEETLGEPYMRFPAEVKRALPAGAPVLNCHIPQGADLRAQSVAQSFALARQFFAAHLPTVPFRAFLCYSWLLYPPMTAQLPESSRIRQLAGRFRIIAACPDPEQALENLTDQGHTTALQSLAARQPDALGFACGVIPL